MKRSSFALAILGAFAGAASAQSSVTIYGLVDLSVMRTSGGSRLGGNSVTELADGVVYGPGSRLGFRTTEDLGSGLRANTLMEAGFAADTGASTQGNSNLGVASRFFGRQIYVALLSDRAGEIRLGRQYTLHDEVDALNNPFSSTTTLTPTYYVSTGGTNPAARNTRLPLFIDSSRVDNAIQYMTPVFGGFKVQAMVAAGEGTLNNQPNAAVSTVPRYEGMKGSYAAGPVNLALSYEQNRVSGVGTSNKTWTLGGNYDFGVAKLVAGYQDAKEMTSYGMAYYGYATNANINIVPASSAGAAFTLDHLRAGTIGVAVPVGLTTLGANYTLVKYEGTAGQTAKLAKFGIGATYYLSKTTQLYATGAMAANDLKDSIQEKRVFQVGMRKAF